MIAGGNPELVEELALTPAGEGRFTGVLTNRFNAPVLPQGGITTVLALRAATEALGRDDLTAVSLYTSFNAQVTPGPVHVHVTVLRNGKSAAQVRSVVRSADGDPAGHDLTVTFAADRQCDIAFTDAAPPAAGPPEAYRDRWEEALENGDVFAVKPTFWDHLESRSVTGHMPWDEWTPTTSEVVTWVRWNDMPVDADGRSSLAALIPPLDTMPGAVFERHGGRGGFYLVPSVDFHVQLYDRDIDPDGRYDGWMLRRNTSRWAGRGLGSADMEVFSADGRLLAFATQLMHIRKADPSRYR